MKTSLNLRLSGFDCSPEHVKLQACAILSAALTATNSRGLVVGHTPQTIGANWYDLFSCFFDTLFLLAFIMTSIQCSGSMLTLSYWPLNWTSENTRNSGKYQILSNSSWVAVYVLVFQKRRVVLVWKLGGWNLGNGFIDCQLCSCSKCDGKIWRIDVGMSSGVLHALPEVCMCLCLLCESHCFCFICIASFHVSVSHFPGNS